MKDNIKIKYYEQGGYFPYQATGVINGKYYFYLRFRHDNLSIEFYKSKRSLDKVDYSKIDKKFTVEGKYYNSMNLKNLYFYIEMEDHEKCNKILNKVFKQLYAGN